MVPGASAGIALGGRGLHRARRRSDVRAAAAFGRRRADAARARVQVRALRGAGGRAGGVDRRHRRRRSRARTRRDPASRAPRRRRARDRRRSRRWRASAGVPIVVDAAFQSFPLSTLSRWARAGDVAVLLRQVLLGPERRRLRGRPLGSRRGHRGARLRGLRVRPLADVRARVQARPGDGRRDRGGARRSGSGSTTTRGSRAMPSWRERWLALRRCGGVSLKQFTLDERLVDGPRQRRRAAAAAVAAGRAELAAGDPSVRAIVDGDALVLCTEALTAAEVEEIAVASPGEDWTMVERLAGSARSDVWSVDTVLLDSFARSSEHRGCVVRRGPMGAPCRRRGGRVCISRQ